MIHPLYTDLPRPERFTYPFCYDPHPLALLAARELQQELGRMTLTEGKMFGVLVVETDQQATIAEAPIGFLAAYSGLLEGRNDWPYFVPPVFDAQQPDGHFKQEERLAYQPCVATTTNEERRQRSQELAAVALRPVPLPECPWRAAAPGGGVAGLPLLGAHTPQISAATRRHGRLLCAEAAAVCLQSGPEACVHGGVLVGTVAELRHPSPRTVLSRLSWQVQARADVDAAGTRRRPQPRELLGAPKLDIQIVYEDDVLIVLNKPSGLLSVPGRIGSYSVATILSQRYPGSLLAHRLDMGTSGLMVAAKSRSVYAALQQQFTAHTVSKTYVALLDTSSPPFALITIHPRRAPSRCRCSATPSTARGRWWTMSAARRPSPTTR